VSKRRGRTGCKPTIAWSGTWGRDEALRVRTTVRQSDFRKQTKDNGLRRFSE
jgi:hypothetical protein